MVCLRFLMNYGFRDYNFYCFPSGMALLTKVLIAYTII